MSQNCKMDYYGQPIYVDASSQPSYPGVYYCDNDDSNVQVDLYIPFNDDDDDVLDQFWDHYKDGVITFQQMCDNLHFYQKNYPIAFQRFMNDNWNEIMTTPVSGQVDGLICGNNQVPPPPPITEIVLKFPDDDDDDDDFDGLPGDIVNGELMPSAFVISTPANPPQPIKQRIPNPCIGCKKAKRKCDEKEKCEKCKKLGTECVRPKRERKTKKNRTKPYDRSSKKEAKHQEKSP